MKRRLPSLLDSLRERVVLTPEEKRVLCFVLAALLLGVTVKHYRDTHPEPAVSTNALHRLAASPTPAPKKQRKKTPSAIPPGETKERD